MSFDQLAPYLFSLITAGITSFLAWRTAKNQTATAVQSLRLQNEHDLERLLKQHEADLDQQKALHALEIDKMRMEHELKLVELEIQNKAQLELNQTGAMNQMMAGVGQSLMSGLFANPKQMVSGLLEAQAEFEKLNPKKETDNP